MAVSVLFTRQLKCTGAQSKYVDVFGGSKSTSQFAPPPVMPLGGGPFTGNFFVPTAAGVCVWVRACVHVCLCVCMHARALYTVHSMSHTALVHVPNTGSTAGLGGSMAYFSGTEQPFPTESTAAQPS